MHVQTHILCGWCAGNLLPLNPRQRLFCMIAASVSDIDGLGRLVSEELYWDYHHRLGHCALFGATVSLVLAAFSPKKVLSFIVYLALFHLHLALDVLGSGSGWKIHYLWPWSEWGFRIDWGWELYSWQNICAFVALLLWTVVIAVRKRRTPLELLMPSLDRRFVAWLSRVPAPSSPLPPGEG
ncbi:MAG TPA: metal-dependent hydrolase [Tepidisphaeraceae bacterium]|jgi:hypothetical protein